MDKGAAKAERGTPAPRKVTKNSNTTSSKEDNFLTITLPPFCLNLHTLPMSELQCSTFVNQSSTSILISHKTSHKFHKRLIRVGDGALSFLEHFATVGGPVTRLKLSMWLMRGPRPV